LINIKTNTHRVNNNNIPISKPTKFGILIGEISGTIPKTKNILKILVPTILPMAKSVLPLEKAIILTVNSGKLVQRAITVAEIKKVLSQNNSAIATAQSTTHLPPKYIHIIPKNNFPKVFNFSLFISRLISFSALISLD
jgi:hypothetical protein